MKVKSPTLSLLRNPRSSILFSRSLPRIWSWLPVLAEVPDTIPMASEAWGAEAAISVAQMLSKTGFSITGGLGDRIPHAQTRPRLRVRFACEVVRVLCCGGRTSLCGTAPGPVVRDHPLHHGAPDLRYFAGAGIGIRPQYAVDGGCFARREKCH